MALALLQLKPLFEMSRCTIELDVHIAGASF